MFIRHPGRFKSRLDKLLYGWLSTKQFTEMTGATPKTVMAWRDRRKAIPQSVIHRAAYTLHQRIDQEIIPQPHCIARLNMIMNRSVPANLGKAA